MSQIFITADEAEKLIPRRPKVHTFIRMFGWLGGHVEREKLLAAFDAAETVAVSQDAACFDHYLAIKIDGMVTYVETNVRALARFGLLPPQRKLS
ncbi:hypothetical protein FOB72_17545 (plasmid) [Cupriavidus pauculus]|uniref:Uncharacterized protein n=1 Tax=Cupriavidus pauculus TaxID=82633 RepID=A0A5P2H712_9BURK|nr:hypothetical protein [Cupriavidus pauculus]QET03967.1 hypothetical protein FOB72_17545 [Cupriavidus pauculus]